MKTQGENSVPSTAGIDHIGKLSDAVYVAFTNGAVAFSDAGLQFSPVLAPNLRVRDYTDWVYSVTQGF